MYIIKYIYRKKIGKKYTTLCLLVEMSDECCTYINSSYNSLLTISTGIHVLLGEIIVLNHF